MAAACSCFRWTSLLPLARTAHTPRSLPLYSDDSLNYVTSYAWVYNLVVFTTWNIFFAKTWKNGSGTVGLNGNHHKSGIRNYSIAHDGSFDIWLLNSTKKNCRMNLIAAPAYKFMTAVLQAAESIFMKLKQDKWCMYSLTLERVRATIAAVAKQCALHNLIVCL